MDARAKGKGLVVGGYAPSDVLADLLEGTSEPVAPEVAAEHAANRIIHALKEFEKNEMKMTNKA